MIISCFLFFLGIFIGSLISRINVSKYTEEMIDLETDIFDMQLVTLASKNTKFTCSLLKNTLDYTSEKTKKIGEDILTYESGEKVMESDYKLLKRRLMLTRIRLWLVLEKLRESCAYNYTSVLYFYSVDGSCDRCQQQGVITSFVSEKSNGAVQISAIDINEDLAVIKALRNSFNVTSTPTLIFNGNDIHRGFIDKDRLTKKVCNLSNNSIDFCKS